MSKENWELIFEQLESGERRSAYPEGDQWVVDKSVKEAILEGFRAGKLTQYGEEGIYCDKHNVLPQKFPVERGVRVVPGGTTVRRGVYVAKGVVMMAPSYANIGAYIDEGTMVDSHALVGSCAQIGKRVHLSAGVQIGGVLEPIGATPVIIEDDAFIGAGSVVVEGIRVKKRAVIAPGVVLSKSVPVYDCVNEVELEKGAPIPEGAIVVPGTRPPKENLTWAKERGLQLQCALIIKYRDAKSDSGLVLEDALRG